MQSRNFTGSIKRGMAVYASLYNRGIGWVVSVDADCNKGDTSQIGGIAATGGGNVQIVYKAGELSDYPECLLRGGVQIGMCPTVPSATDEELNQYIQNAELVKRQTIEAEQKEKAAFDAKVAELEVSPAYAHLTPLCGSKGNEAAHVARNIRAELKKAGIKGVSVRSERSTIRIYWTDGAPERELKELFGKFKHGYFDGMEDIYVSNASPFSVVFGGVDYIFYNRDYSDAVIADLLKTLAERFGQPVLTVVDYMNNRLRDTVYETEFYEAKKELDCRKVLTSPEEKGSVSATHCNEQFLYKIGEHTKTHKTLHIVKLLNRVERETWVSFNNIAQSFKGYYSRYVGGFIFPTEANAKSFMDY
ncbi:LPD29 domain-containing protein [Vibrio harveyi]|uniref:LPD29 domain-containing protein n=1 Tax=Vibrio harveyi TaxID=669 RepID=UPI002480594E|nr:LPD29 domain-containing protein [Vibrio harveyi]